MDESTLTNNPSTNDLAKPKKKKKSVPKKPKRKEVEFEIKVKGEDGQVQKYTE